MQVSEIEFVQLLNEVAIHRHHVAVWRRVAGIGRDGRQANAYALIAPDFDDLFGHFQGEARAVLDRPAILICAVISRITQELIQQITVGRVNLYAIKTSAFGIFGGTLVLLDDSRDFIGFESPRHRHRNKTIHGIGIAFGLDGGGSDRRGAIWLQLHAGKPAHMPKLADDLAASGVHCVGRFFPTSDLFIAPDAWCRSVAASLSGNIGCFSYDQTRTGPLGVVLGVQFIGNAIFGIAAACDGRHYDAVGKFHRPHSDGSEQVSTVTVVCHGKPQLNRPVV
ncbi:hypothetical protein D3C86_1374880 [compost metagenome]